MRQTTRGAAGGRRAVGTDWQKQVGRAGRTAAILLGMATMAALRAAPAAAQAESDQAAVAEQRLLSQPRQITFAGRRAGEGYFSGDGRRMVFQSEREPGNPFFQIYLLDFQTGDLQRVSPGVGKTTCAWIHPDGDRVLFASTHHDPAAEQKQQQELQRRQDGRQRRYDWDYDPEFELYAYERPAGEYTRLTHQRGYDAEGSYSPDGQWIAFSSNHHAHAAELSEADAERLEVDPSFFLDIYLMRADGSQLRRLTDADGYDGGPFFSPDGQRICWRRFSPDGTTAEIFTMNVDGSDVRRITSLGAMSWAPFYHPSGRYLVFTTNLHGFGNFELYVVDVDGQHTPVRVTYTDGFDGLPVFTPDGQQLAWTTNRTASANSQIYLAGWNHVEALRLLGLDAADESGAVQATALRQAADEAQRAAAASQQEFSAADVLRHVDYLCRPELGGRLTGTDGEQLATAYVASYFDHLGLEPAGDDGTWFQSFTFTAGVELGRNNRLLATGQPLELDRQWRPLAFSQTGPIAARPLAFAGYGMKVPGGEEHPEYDSYVHLDAADRWVMVLRFMPEEIPAERRQQWARYSSLRYKAMVARDQGAAGLIIVTGPNSQSRHELIPLETDGTFSGSSIPVISVSRDTAEAWLQAAGKSLQALQDQLDDGQPVMGFPIDHIELQAQIDIRQIEQQGRNVLARLRAGQEAAEQTVIVGAHIDHLGTGTSAASLAREDERDLPHLGADDNASGVAAMLEIAEWLVGQKSADNLALERDIVFAAWSGEELGLLGSSHFANRLAEQLGTGGSLYPHIAACVNLDMVGRFDQRLVLQGIGSSGGWRAIIEQRNAVVGLPLDLQQDSYLPTDASTFYLRGVPILSAFTGSHRDYHTPRDTPDKLNYAATARIARLMALISRSLAASGELLEYQKQKAPDRQPGRAALRAYLGTIPDYVSSDQPGVPLAGVADGGPADKAGLKAGDVIVRLAGREISNIYDYTYAIEALKIGQEITVQVLRDGEEVTMRIVPESRQ